MRVVAEKQDGRSFLIVQAQYLDEIPALHALANELVGPLDDGWTTLAIEVMTTEAQDKIFEEGAQVGKSIIFNRLRGLPSNINS